MTKFILKMLLFFALLLLFRALQLGLVLTNLNANDSSNYYGINRAKDRIILVGSSNLDYNYDYEKLNSHFDGYDVIGCNLNEPSGLYATLFKLKKLKPTSTDFIIFCLPHSLFEPDKLIPLGSSGKKGYTPDLISQSLTEFPKYFAKSVFNLKTSDTFKLLSEGSLAQRKSGTMMFDMHTEADTIADFMHCKKLNGQFDITSMGCDKEYLLEIKDYIEQNFASRVAFRFPAVKESEFTLSSERLEFLRETFPLINDFDQSIYSDQYWYNQWYHLNSCGRERNTNKLIDELSTLTDEH